MQHDEIIEIIEKTAPLQAALPWDKSGIQVASFKKDARRLAVFLDPTLAQIRRATDWGADFILAHHPFGMTPRFPDKPDDYLAALSLLLGKEITLYSAHTSLDANPQGPAAWLPDALGLRNRVILERSFQNQDGLIYGCGLAGDLPAPMPYADFCRLLAQKSGKAGWTGCGPRPATIKRAACCPGSGSSLMEAARAAGADVLITGDVKYHSALEAPLRVLDFGHFHLEEEMMRRFAEQLKAAMPQLEVEYFSAADPLAPEAF